MELPDFLPSDWFKKQFEKRLQRPDFAEGKQAWDDLLKNGCDRSVLLACLELYCRHKAAEKDAVPSDSYVQEFLENSASMVAQVQALAKDVERIAARMEEISREPDFWREIIWSDEYKYQNVSSDLRSYASWLKKTAGRIRSPFNVRDQPGQLLNYASGYIKVMTGVGVEESSIFLTKLVRVGYAAVGINEQVDEDSIGKAVRRARLRLKKRQAPRPSRV